MGKLDLSLRRMALSTSCPDAVEATYSIRRRLDARVSLGQVITSKQLDSQKGTECDGL